MIKKKSIFDVTSDAKISYNLFQDTILRCHDAEEGEKESVCCFDEVFFYGTGEGIAVVLDWLDACLVAECEPKDGCVVGCVVACFNG